MVAQMIDRPPLVLNRNWQPVNVATVARALTMLWNDTARVVDSVDYQTYDWHDWMQLPSRLKPHASCLLRPWSVPDSHASPRSSQTRFDSWQGHLKSEG